MTAKEKIFEYVRDNYGTEPEYPWAKTPEFAVLRHSSNKKWYGLIMSVNGKAFGLDDTAEGTAFPAYHMNKKKWLSVPLESYVTDEVMHSLIDESYELTK